MDLPEGFGLENKEIPLWSKIDSQTVVWKIWQYDDFYWLLLLMRQKNTYIASL